MRSHCRLSSSLFAIAGCLIFAMVISVMMLGEGESRQRQSEVMLDEAWTAYGLGRYEAALQLANQVREFSPENVRAILIVATANARFTRFAEARSLLVNLDEKELSGLGDQLFECGLSFRIQKQFEDAEEWFLKSLESAAPPEEAVRELVTLYRFSGRNQAAAALLRRLVADDKAELRDILLLALPSMFWAGEPDLSSLESTKFLNDTNPIANLGLARQALKKEQPRIAVDLLQKAISAAPDLIDAHAWLGVALVRLEDYPSLAVWELNLPKIAVDQPMVWFARGELAAQRGMDSAATRCFWEAVKGAPTDAVAVMRLGQCLRRSGYVVDAENVSQRASNVARLTALSRDLLATREFTIAQEFIRTLESLEMTEEAAALCRIAVNWKPRQKWYGDKLLQLNSRAKGPVLPLAMRLKLTVDIAERFPLPGDARVAIKEKHTPVHIFGERSHSIVKFREVAASAGIEHTFFNGADAAGTGAYMFEFSGAGIGILDYDGNGWQDIYLTQGNLWPTSARTTDYRNRLFRNLGDDTFKEVGLLADVSGSGYGQGATVADFNNDGFADLYISNIGVNRLYENNGDGTYSDRTKATGTGGDCWSISSAAADFNGDSRPDLFVVNYLEGEDLWTRQCAENGFPTQCLPQLFPAAMDCLYRNLDEGHFEDVTMASGIAIPNGKGMALIASDVNQDRLLDVVVANDTEPNFLFLNSSTGAEIRFKEEAILSGVALGRDGKPQSSMGLAMADINLDRWNDIFVTNFYQEPNNLFVGIGNAFFQDAMAHSGLAVEGMASEGWGAQFLDADLDGLPDLFVANGHLQDFAPDTSGKMQAHFFRNRGGEFQLVDPAQTCDYLKEKHFGRSVAVADWNRDGRPDLCVSHVDTPTALLQNETDCRESHFLTVKLVGTKVSRDAVGAIVSVELDGTTLSGDLKAGHGYACSNERSLMFGLGTRGEINNVIVVWPSGEAQALGKVTPDAEIVVIEGQGFFVLPDHRSLVTEP